MSLIELAGLRARVTEAEMNIGVDSVKCDFEKLIHNIPPDTKVVIIDSLGIYTAKLTPYEFRDRFDHLIYELKQEKITSMIILDSSTSHEYSELALFSVYGAIRLMKSMKDHHEKFESLRVYGAIRLMKRENPYTGQRERIMDIIKMRSTKTPIEFIRYDIDANGIEIIDKIEKEI